MKLILTCGRYNKDRRDEAVSAHRNWIAKRAGKPVAEVIHEPRIRKIKSKSLSTP